jgi:RNA polymerase sigma factor (sigma-70 family)
MSARAISPELFEAAQRGDRRAINGLLIQAQPDIRRYARSACRSSADVEDAMQETLWQLSRHIGALRSLLAVSRWLFTVVQRECIRLARKAARLPPLEQDLAEEAILARPEADLRLDVAAAFESLPPQFREVALMRDIREMTIDDIALALGLTRETVKARLHRARVLLRDYLTR